MFILFVFAPFLPILLIFVFDFFYSFMTTLRGIQGLFRWIIIHSIISVLLSIYLGKVFNNSRCLNPLQCDWVLGEFDFKLAFLMTALSIIVGLVPFYLGRLLSKWKK